MKRNRKISLDIKPPETAGGSYDKYVNLTEGAYGKNLLPPANQISDYKNKRAGIIAKLFKLAGLALLLFIIAYGSFFVWKIHSVSKKISVSNESSVDSSFLQTVRSLAKNEPTLRSSSPDRINILLLGIAGEGKPGQFLTDTIMIASLDTKNGRVALLSIPRDFYVEIPELKIQMKINSVYTFGLQKYEKNVSKSAELISKTLSEATSLAIDYYMILNFDGFEKAIDSIGGINIINERDIYDSRYPGPNYSYEIFELPKGFHQLDGKTALKYARERHNDPEGDFGRAKRQQQVMQAVKNKIFSAKTLLNAFALNNLLDALGNNVQTNINPDEIGSFIELIKRLDTQNINNFVLDAWTKDSLLKVSHVNFGEARAFVLVPRVGNYSEIQDLAQNIFDLNKLKRVKEEITKENAKISILNQSGERAMAEKLTSVLFKLEYKDIAIINSRNHKVKLPTSGIYDFTGGTKPFTLNEISTKLPAEINHRETADIRDLAEENNLEILIIVGEDLVTKYNTEEGTIEDLNNERDNQESVDFK